MVEIEKAGLVVAYSVPAAVADVPHKKDALLALWHLLKKHLEISRVDFTSHQSLRSHLLSTAGRICLQ